MNYYNQPFGYNQPQQREIPSLPQFNAQQFSQMVNQLNPNTLNLLAQLARAQGMSEQDIMFGMEYIKKLV